MKTYTQKGTNNTMTIHMVNTTRKDVITADITEVLTVNSTNNNEYNSKNNKSKNGNNDILLMTPLGSGIPFEVNTVHNMQSTKIWSRQPK